MHAAGDSDGWALGPRPEDSSQAYCSVSWSFVLSRLSESGRHDARPYSACPCGSGKKLKFCCSSLAGELDKIWRMLDGDQWAACLQRVTSLLQKEPDQPALLAIRGMVEIELGTIRRRTRDGDALSGGRSRQPGCPRRTGPSAGPDRRRAGRRRPAAAEYCAWSATRFPSSSTMRSVRLGRRSILPGRLPPRSPI